MVFCVFICFVSMVDMIFVLLLLVMVMKVLICLIFFLFSNLGLDVLLLNIMVLFKFVDKYLVFFGLYLISLMLWLCFNFFVRFVLIKLLLVIIICL